MNRNYLIAAISLAAAVGCTSRTNDLPWLTKIDQALNTGDFDYSLKEAAKYVEKYPDSCEGWSALGWATAKTDDLDRAQECFDKCLKINPQWDNAYVGKGVTYRKAGDLDNARKSYLEAVRIVPDNAEAYSSLLVIEVMEGDNKKAVEYGQKAWALRQDLASIPANLAVAYHFLGDIARRDQYYKHAERLGYHRLQTLKDIFDGKVSIDDQ